LAAAKILLHWVEGMMAVFGRNQEMSLKELQAHVAVVKAEIAGREYSETLSSAMLAPGCRHVRYLRAWKFRNVTRPVTPAVVVPSPLSLIMGMAARDVGLLLLTVKRHNTEHTNVWG
jgi:hypothetical protein